MRFAASSTEPQNQVGVSRLKRQRADKREPGVFGVNISGLVSKRVAAAIGLLLCDVRRRSENSIWIELGNDIKYGCFNVSARAWRQTGFGT